MVSYLQKENIFIEFVDSDDWLHPTMYEVLINLIEKIT